MVHLLFFLGRDLKKLRPYLESTSSNFSKTKFSSKKGKKLNLEAKLLYLDNFELEFEKPIAIFEIINFIFVKKQIFMLKKKKLSSGPKIFCFRIPRIEY